MLEYAHTGALPSLCMVIDHDDEEREYAYCGASVTNPDAESILDTAERFGWTVVSMRDDWGRVFAMTTWIEGATFRMGSDGHHAEEGPIRSVTVDGFWIDPHAVTNRDYAAFVHDTGYVTVAERPLDPADFPGAPAENLVPGSMVFRPTPRAGRPAPDGALVDVDAGRVVAAPGGPGHDAPRSARTIPSCTSPSRTRRPTPTGRARALPTEAEWELAARGGLDGALYTWGDEPEPPGARLANYWHGDFPYRAEPGYGTTAPVGSFAPNGFGLYDMAGNVWEWTSDWYTPRLDPAQPTVRVPRKVVKGGSFLCADSYCARYRPAARRPQMIDTGMSHIGFRCVRRT